MHPSQVLDCQADLIARASNGRLRQHMQEMLSIQGWRSTRDGKFSEKDVELINRNVARTLMGTMPGIIETAYAYRVTHEMSMVVQHAASLLEGTDQFNHTLAPTGCGLVYFDRPLPLVDMRGKTMLIHWLAWGPAPMQVMDAVEHVNENVYGATHIGGAMSVWWWNDHYVKADEIGERLEEQFPEWSELLGRWGFIGADICFDGLRLGPPTALQPYMTSEGVAVESTNVTRYIHALWLLLNQTVTSVRTELPDRKAAKRARRMGIPDRVSVIALRRMENVAQYEGESDVEWAHRWVVRGHWRWQACGPALTERHRIWIAPYVKGPEDKPLVITDKVYSLQR